MSGEGWSFPGAAPGCEQCKQLHATITYMTLADGAFEAGLRPAPGSSEDFIEWRDWYAIKGDLQYQRDRMASERDFWKAAAEGAGKRNSDKTLVKLAQLSLFDDHTVGGKTDHPTAYDLMQQGIDLETKRLTARAERASNWLNKAQEHLKGSPNTEAALWEVMAAESELRSLLPAEIAEDNLSTRMALHVGGEQP